MKDWHTIVTVQIFTKIFWFSYLLTQQNCPKKITEISKDVAISLDPVMYFELLCQKLFMYEDVLSFFYRHKKIFLNEQIQIIKSIKIKRICNKNIIILSSYIQCLYNVYTCVYNYLPWSSRGGIFHDHNFCDVSILGEILPEAL